MINISLKILPFVRKILPVSLVLICNASFNQSKKVCFTFDDLPYVIYNQSDSILFSDLFHEILSGLESNNIPAVGFVNEGKLYRNNKIQKSHVELLRDWVNSGMDLGNHTFSHMDFNNVGTSDFVKDIKKGSLISNDLIGEKGDRVVYFRHPYLHVGNSEERADTLSNFLHEQGYIVAPVTFDNDDYLFAAAYEKIWEQNDQNLLLKIGRDYINYSEMKIKYYENQTKSLFGREINQIMLLHPSLLNAKYIDSLILIFNKRDYKFINLDEALSDNVYNTEITRFGNWGISWIDRWALSMGKKGDFFENEPTVPDYILKMTGQ